MFATYLRTLREERGLSQRNVAKDLCSRSYLSLIETGKRMPSAVFLVDLADKLGGPTDILVGEYIRDPNVSMNQVITLASLLALKGRSAATLEALSAARARVIDSPYRLDYLALADETQGDMHFTESQFRTALRCYRRALRRYRKTTSRPLKLARALFKVGNTSIKLGKYWIARVVLTHGYRLISSLEPGSVDHPSGKIHDLHLRIVQSLGHVLLHRRDFASASVLYSTARDYWQENGIEPPAAILLGEGLTGLGNERLQQGRVILQKVLLLSSDPIEQTTSLNYLSIIHRLQGRWKEAEALLSEALDILRKSNVTQYPHAIQNELARCFLATGRYDEAARCLDDIEQNTRSETNVHPALLVESYLLRGRLCSLQGMRQQASEILDLASRITGVSRNMRRLILLEKLRTVTDSDSPLVHQLIDDLETELQVGGW